MFCLGDDTPHNLTCLRNVLDQHASFAGNYAGNIEVATLPCCGVFATNLPRCGCQFVFMSHPTLTMTVG